MSDEPIAIAEKDNDGWLTCCGSLECSEPVAIAVRNLSCPESIWLCRAHAAQLRRELGSILLDG